MTTSELALIIVFGVGGIITLLSFWLVNRTNYKLEIERKLSREKLRKQNQTKVGGS